MLPAAKIYPEYLKLVHRIQGAPKLLGLCNKTTLAPKLYKIQQF